MNATRNPQENAPSEPNRDVQAEPDRRTIWLRCLSPLYPVLAVWGMKWLVDAALFFAEKYRDTSGAHTIAFTAAVVLSAIAFCLQLMRAKRPLLTQLDPILKIGTPLLLLAAAAWWLVRIGAVGDAYVPVLHTLLAAVVLVTAGLFVSAALAYLGLWLLLASTIMSALYLGYSAIVLNAFGGLALLVAAWHLNRLRQRNIAKGKSSP